MALNLSRKLRDALKKEKIERQLIVEIDGIDYVFGIGHVKKHWRIGEDNLLIGQDGLTVGGTVKANNSLALIDHKKTSSSITQQLDFEQGVSSVSSIKVSLVDENGVISREFSPTATFDILGREATVYWGIKDFSHPEDSVVIFEGIIDDCVFGQGYVDIKIAHPEQLKRQAIFTQAQSELAASIGAEDTEIELASASGFLQPWDSLDCYLKINDEIIQYDRIENGVFVDCTRGALNTLPAAHDEESDVTSFYRLTGNPIDLALKLMLSQDFLDEDGYAQNVANLRLNEVAPDRFVQNSVVFDRFVLSRLNVKRGDTIRLTVVDDARPYPAGNEGFATILEVVKLDQVEYVVLDKYLETDNDGVYNVEFFSQYNTLSTGCKLKPKYVDIDEFERIRTIASNSMVECEIYIKDTIDNAKEFIDKKLLLPQGLFSIPRKGKISVGKTMPPIADAQTKFISHHNIVKGASPELRRSTNKNFYNSVRYEFHEDSLEDKFLRKSNFFDLTSLTKIKVGNRPLIIEAYSLRDSSDTRNFIDAQAKRFLERYKFSAEIVSLKVNLKTGFSIEVGDTAIVDLSAYKLGDITSRSRSFIPRLMEVVNKNLDMRSNTVTLELATTTFEVDARYGTIAPSSYVASGASESVIPLRKILPKTTQIEKEKWEAYIGQRVTFRAPDWSWQEESVIIGIAPGADALEVRPLSIVPPAGTVLSVPEYDDSDYREMALYKRLHAFINPSLTVTAGVSDTVFEVSSADMAKLSLGSIVYVHAPDYSRKGHETIVKELGGSTVTLESGIGFTPEAGDRVNLVGFLDGGLPYRLV